MAKMTPAMLMQRDSAYKLHAAKAAQARTGIQFGKAKRRMNDILACDPPLTAEQYTFLIEQLQAAREHVS